jgi:hypothetical protein
VTRHVTFVNKDGGKAYKMFPSYSYRKYTGLMILLPMPIFQIVYNGIGVLSEEV